jgi:hypothetical protein
MKELLTIGAGFAIGMVVRTTRWITFWVLMCLWVVGWVLAEGFWPTLFSVVFPPWGWYLLAERVLWQFGL